MCFCLFVLLVLQKRCKSNDPALLLGLACAPANTQPPTTWECSNSTLLIYFLSSLVLLHLDGGWMYVGGTAAGGRRVRGKLCDENANSFLVKEEKAWCRIFPLVAEKRQHMAGWPAWCKPCEGTSTLMQAGKGGSSLQRQMKNNPS